MREVLKLQEMEGLLRQLDTAEAFNVAYVGSKPGNRNSRQLQNWRTKIINRLNKLVYGGARQTVWNTIGRKARRF